MSKLSAYLLAISAYFIWGVSPIYFKSIDVLPATEIIIQRIIWSAICCVLVIFFIKNKNKWKELLVEPKYLAILLCTALMLSINWLTYVWAVNNNYMLEASLGYYITPLISVALGTIILKEKIRKFQWAAFAFAIIGVLIQIVLMGELPWISVLIAFSFSLYGLVRKMVPINVFPAMMIETWILVPIALIWLFLHSNAMTLTDSFWHSHLLWLAMLAGPLTLVPLILFNLAAKHLPYSTIGFLQYLAPTLMFLFAVLYFHEDFSIEKLATFVFIWAGLVLFSLDSYFTRRGGKFVSK